MTVTDSNSGGVAYQLLYGIAPTRTYSEAVVLPMERKDSEIRVWDLTLTFFGWECLFQEESPT